MKSFQTLMISVYCAVVIACATGSKRSEDQIERDISAEPTIEEIQKRFQRMDGRPVGDIRRAAHARHYGCLEAEFEVLANTIPPPLTKGIFKNEGKIFPAWVRFSPGTGSTRKSDKVDEDPDLRGLAVKVLGVSGPSSQDKSKFTDVQDFLFTNRPVPFIANAEEQMHLFKSSSSPRLWGKISFIRHHPFRIGHISEDTGRQVQSLWDETYWSRLPFLMDDAAKDLDDEGKNDELLVNAVKFVIYPCDQKAGNAPLLSDEDFAAKGRTYLAEDFLKRAREKDQCFEIGAQMRNRLNLAETPIEDPMTEWKTSVRPLARVHIPANQTEHLDAALKAQEKYASNEKVNDYCEQLAFSPWNGLRAHTPLGSANRARLQVMRDSQAHRSKLGGYVPLSAPSRTDMKYIKR